MDNSCDHLSKIETTTAAIAQNLCNQLIAFQESISTRPEGQRFPGGIEVALLCKLINCLDKIRKWLIQSNNNREMSNFLRYLKNSDKDLAKTVSARYNEFKCAQCQMPQDGPAVTHENPFTFSHTPLTAESPAQPAVENINLATEAQNEPQITKETNENTSYILANPIDKPLIEFVPGHVDEDPIALQMPPLVYDGEDFYYLPYNDDPIRLSSCLARSTTASPKAI